MAKEVVVLIALPKRGAGSHSNVVVRGVQEASIPLRPQVKLVAGRLFRMGSSEIIVGNSIAKGFTGVGLQGTLNWGMRKWTVVGIFDAGNTGFSSEIWGDVDQVMQAFRRPVYSSLIFKLNNPAAFPAAKTAIETDPRLTLEAKRETRYYLDQSEMMAKFLRILGLSLTIIFSIGAIIGAMITMYSAVANRIGEIGTMRALGFRRRSILAAFLAESLLLGCHRRRGGALLRLLHAVHHRFHGELSDLFGTGVQIHPHRAHRPAGHGLFPRHGLHRRHAAGAPRLPDEDRRRPAGGVGQIPLAPACSCGRFSIGFSCRRRADASVVS